MFEPNIILNINIMLKNILNLDGVTRLSSKEQSVIKGSGCAIAVRNADGSFGYWLRLHIL